MTLKVYGWTSRRNECEAGANGNHQTREIMAAHSAAEVMRATGLSRTQFNHSACVTGNDAEVTLAMSKPGTVFWIPLTYVWRGDRNPENWVEVSPPTE